MITMRECETKAVTTKRVWTTIAYAVITTRV